MGRVEVQNKEEHKVINQRRERRKEMNALWDKVDAQKEEIEKLKKDKTLLKREITKMKRGEEDV